jgi:hypothetical protein
MENNNNKGGRPKIIQKRNIGKTIWLNNEELEILNQRFSQGEYLSFNDMIRDILINNRYKIITLDFDAKIQRNILIEETRRIGNNFNQLVKLFNQKKLDHFTKEEIVALNTVVIQIKNIYDKIEKTLSS